MKDRLVWAGALLYAFVFTGLGALKYAVHRNLVDFGIFAQTTASAFGCFCNTVEGSHWAYHFSPILYIAGAAVGIARSPFALIALQALACALAVPPIAAIVAARSDVRVARLVALVVLLYPPLAGLAFGDFHENVFAPATVAWMLWAFDRRAYRLAVFFAVLTLCIKEDQAVFLAVAGAVGTLHFRRSAAGRTSLIVTLMSVGVLLAFYVVIRPHSSALGSWPPLRFYAWTHADVSALLPTGVLQRAGFLLLAFAPLAFLPFRSRVGWLAVLPLAEVLFSRMPTAFTMGTHYAGAWLGYVLTPFAFAARDLSRQRAGRVIWVCVALCAIEFVVADPLHPGMNLRLPEPKDAALDRFLTVIPQEADVATQEEAYTHLALDDPNARVFPESSGVPIETCFALVDQDFADSPRLQEYGAALQRLVRNGRYAPVRTNGAIHLYERSFSAATVRCTHPSTSRTAR